MQAQRNRKRRAIRGDEYTITCHRPLISLPSSMHALSRPPVRLHCVTHCSHLVLYAVHTGLEREPATYWVLPLRSKLNAIGSGEQ